LKANVVQHLRIEGSQKIGEAVRHPQAVTLIHVDSRASAQNITCLKFAFTAHATQENKERDALLCRERRNETLSLKLRQHAAARGLRSPT
jgi:hypothetical protein